MGYGSWAPLSLPNSQEWEKRMADVKFTKQMVRKLADQVEEFTGGTFGLSGTGLDQGNGVRYFSKHDQKVWLGPEGAREASAYLIGGALEYAKNGNGEIPDDMLWLRDVQDAYSPKQRYRNWEEQGRERARFYLNQEV